MLLGAGGERDLLLTRSDRLPRYSCNYIPSVTKLEGTLLSGSEQASQVLVKGVELACLFTLVWSDCRKAEVGCCVLQYIVVLF